MKFLFILLQVEWYCFTRSSAHALLPYVLFGLLRCPTSRNTATSQNIESWFWLCLLSSNKLDVLVYCWLRLSDISYQGMTVFYSVIIIFSIVTCGGGTLTVSSIMPYNSTVVASNYSVTTTKAFSTAKASSTSSSSESSSMATIS